ncbi:MAG: sensor histidine kinase [Lysobacterales bacterium]
MNIIQNLRMRLVRVHEFLVPPKAQLSYTPYLWLVYNGFLLLPIFYGTASKTETAVTLASFAFFLPLYFSAFRVQGRALLPFVAGCVLLGLIVTPFNMGGTVYFIHACAFSALIGPPVIAMRYTSLAILTALLQVWWLGMHPSVAIVTTLVGYVVAACNIFYRKMELKNEALRLSREEVKRLASTAERERIARDLHDLLGHTLASITLKAELARRTVLEQPEAAYKELEDIERISRQAASQVRSAVAGYRAGRIQSELASGRQLLESAGVWLDVEVQPQELTAEQENILALTLREALTNVHRHAKASRCWVLLSGDEQQIRLVVRDDGRGGNVRPGAGIKGMRERLHAVGGQLQVESNSPHGLIVQMMLNVSGPEHNVALTGPVL